MTPQHALAELDALIAEHCNALPPAHRAAVLAWAIPRVRLVNDALCEREEHGSSAVVVKLDAAKQQ